MKLVSAFPRLAFAPLPAPPGFFALPLRLIVGYGFMAHGFAKLARGPEVFIGILHAIGLPFSFFLGWATILIELIGGLVILLGAFVPLASVPMIVVLLVAIFTVHLPNGFSSIKLVAYDGAGAHFGQPGYETDLLYVAGLLALCFGGAGPFSVDGFVKPRLVQGQAKPRIRSGDDEGAFMSGPLIHSAKAGTVQKLDGPTGTVIGADNLLQKIRNSDRLAP